ncbi:hypothetical protein DdX_21803 [Ditylenchus destructor]|uniref:Uncharacterized protein n=1 Tax=Ditylenchus destructor TaxID=166010 RepID=A0AAD4MF91_9BILA|nr:hypothetical protein DdX_21803 [Ditylenchus destructor]
MAARPGEKSEDETPEEPKAKKSRSDDRTSNIATLDNGTMVESFKYLNYMQLAKSGLVSKRFWNIIRNNRHRLAILNVGRIIMLEFENARNLTHIKMSDKELTGEGYNEWVIRNGYSKEIPLEGPVTRMRSQQHNSGRVYKMIADYRYPQFEARTIVLNAHVELNHYNWPLFQHFLRILTAPSVHINYLRLTPQIDVSFINLLAGAMMPDSNRIRCGKMELYSDRAGFEDTVQKFIGWIKNHVLCKEFRVSYDSDTNIDEEMLDFFVTGAHCTSEIFISQSDLSFAIVAFVQVN